VISSVTNMTPSASVTVGRSQFDDFLFAQIGQEANGMWLSVLSVLARLDIDPWQEAATLAQMSRNAATERLRLLLAGLPEEWSGRSDPEAIATRLIALLPGQRPVKSSPTTLPQRKLVIRPSRRVIFFFVLMGFMLGTQFLARSVQPSAQVNSLAPSTISAPNSSR
jgi:hypothetical protein